MGGIKHDSDKLRMDLIPVEALEELARVLTYGAAKYAENNWQEVEAKRYEAALLRHYALYKKGETHDSESDILHLSHMLANVAFLLYKQINSI